MDKRLAYLLIAIIVLITLGMTLFIYWSQTNNKEDTSQKEQQPEVYFAGGTNAEVSIPDQELTAGQIATVPIYISTDDDVATVQVVFEYNSSLLQIEDTITNESDQFDTPYSFTIDDLGPNSKAILTANSLSSGVNTNGTQILLANLRITPQLPAGQTSTTTSLNFTFDANSTEGSYATALTSLDNILSQPTNTSISISGDSSASSTTLSIEEKELVLDEETTIDITLSTPEIITAADIIIIYDPTYLEISTTYVESTDMTEYTDFAVDATNGQVTIAAANPAGVTGDITIITLNVTPLDTTTATNMTFDYTVGSTTDTNISTSTSTDILTTVNNATYEVVEEATSYACYAACDSGSQCPNSVCALQNGDYICIDLDCTDATQCECPESGYLSNAGGTGGTFFADTASGSGTISPTPTPTATTTPTATPKPTPVIDDLPEAGSTHMTFAVLALGLSALLLGLITKKDLH